MPVGHRDRSLRSSPAHRAALTFVASAICSSDTPRWIRMRRRFGPKASCSLMVAAVPPQERDHPSRVALHANARTNAHLGEAAATGCRPARAVSLQEITVSVGANDQSERGLEL